MKKAELDSLLKQSGIPVNEGVTSIKNTGKYPRCVYWDYIIQDSVASGEAYEMNVTYQISHFAKAPRDPSLMKIKRLFREHGLFPQINVEYIEEDKVFHSYFAVEVTEEIDAEVEL